MRSFTSLCWISLLVILFSIQSPVKHLLSPDPSLSLPGVHHSTTSLHGIQNQGSGVGAHSLYLPLVFAPDPFLKDAPIWAHSGSPAPQEVALFRHTFTVSEPVSGVRLAIFADTRYQVWIDGAFIGRGPARFSPTLREYDVYKLGDFLPGSHTISVQVQWAPNLRRSESISPYLQAHIEGDILGRYKLITRTGREWRSSLSGAWRQDSAPVHSWGLIGPTELLDLRKLPENWHQPGFSDADWKPAHVLHSTEGTLFASAQLGHSYRARSIDLLIQKEITSTLIDAGFLSPGFVTSEIIPPFTEPVELQFSSF